MIVDISSITNPEAKRFLIQFFRDRAINREFYEHISEDKFDYRMVDTPERKSDSPRESLAHQIDVERDYINGIRTGILKFGIEYADLSRPITLNKIQLLKILETGDEELVKLLGDPNIGDKKVNVPWSKSPISAITTLWALDNHEILHTGWNLAVMDHLNIVRFPNLKQMWG